MKRCNLIVASGVMLIISGLALLPGTAGIARAIIAPTPTVVVDDDSLFDPASVVCEKKTIVEGQVTTAGCDDEGVEEGTPCIKCAGVLPSSYGKISNSTGGPGMEEQFPLGVCYNATRYVGQCVDQVCTKYGTADGKCAGTFTQYEPQTKGGP